VPSIEDRCSLRSDARAEPLAGTASTARRWFLLEWAGPWGREGVLDARLPGDLGRTLHDLGRSSRARVLLIRRVDRHADVEGAVTCFAIDTTGPNPWIGRRELTSIAEAAVVDPIDRASFDSMAEPLAVVCTHGRRDVCCAERGRPLALATAAAFPSMTWESTHVGGDRFAGNLVLFPHGLYFGRVEATRGPEVVGAYARGRIVLDRFRGRSSLPTFAQAAEVALRRRLRLDGVDDVTMESATLDGDVGTVRLRVGADLHVIDVRRRSDPPMRLTCRSSAEESPQGWDVR
jgi:hypothetical protein